MFAGHETFTTVLLDVLLGMTPLHFCATFVLAIHGLMTTVPLMFLQSVLNDDKITSTS